jgi:zinc transporter
MNEHIHFAFVLSGPGAGKPLQAHDEIAAALKAPELAWLHMQADSPATEDWVESYLDYLDWPIRAALIADETRPRALAIENGLMLILRGINTNPGEDPEDMVSLRLWVDPARIVSLSRRPLYSVADLARETAEGHPPGRAGAFLCRLLSRIEDHIDDALDALETATDGLEEDILKGEELQLQGRMTEARQQVVNFRRHVAPQRDALAALAGMRFDWLTKSDRRSLHEAYDRMIRHVEELDAIRDRLALIRDEIANAQSERVNRKLYFLSVISAVFLPLGFLTGLMGINLAGMPGEQTDGAFWFFTGLLAAVVAVQILILRWLRLF